jgi:hypothetical protein
MSLRQEVEELALEKFAFLKEYGFQNVSAVRKNFITTLRYLNNRIGIEVELDWRDLGAFVLIVNLEHGELPKGYYVSDGKVVRIHLQKVLAALGCHLSNVNKKRSIRRPKDYSTETIKKEVERQASLLKETVGLILNKQELIFNTN